MSGKFLYLLSCLSGLVCLEIDLQQSQGGFPFKQVTCFNYLGHLSSTTPFQDSVGPRVSWMWTNVQALPAGMVPSVWTSLTAMSVAVQRVRVDRETVARARRWAGGLMGVKD